MKRHYSICIIIIFFAFATNCAIPEKKQNKKAYPPASSLDSLQGKWINDEDSSNVITVTGRSWNDKYTSSSITNNETYLIYFSDTIVNSQNFSTALIDTSASSGKYIIAMSPSDNSMDCWQFNGFYHDSIDTTFSVNPAVNWTMKSIRVFKKIQ